MIAMEIWSCNENIHKHYKYNSIKQLESDTCIVYICITIKIQLDHKI